MPVTSYTVAIRRRTATDWTAWAYGNVSADTHSYECTELRRGTSYR